MLLAAGQAVLASLQSTTFCVSYILMSAAALIISAVMLRSGNSGKCTRPRPFRANSRSAPLARISYTYGYVVHPDSPKAFPIGLVKALREDMLIKAG
jgi:hypothetical protein